MGVHVREKNKGSGEWWIFIHHKNRRKARKVGNRKDALEFAKKIQARLILDDFWIEDKKAPTLEEYYPEFKKIHFPSLRESSQVSYEGSFGRHLLPRFGKTPLDEITRRDLKAFAGELMKKGLSKASIKIVFAALSRLFNEAIDDELVSIPNPAVRQGKSYKEAKVVHEEIEPLTRHEVPIFLQAVVEVSPYYYPLFLCAIHAGLREGELAGAQWGDVDFIGKFLEVRRAYKRGKVMKLKTRKSRRKVDLSDALLNELQTLKQRRAEEWKAKGLSFSPEWVFCNQEGNALDMQHLKNRHFLKCLRKAELRRIRFHDLRHTFASLLIQNGESLAYVRDQMGHSSIRVTVDTYGHLVPGANREAVNRLPTIQTLSSNLIVKAS